MTRLKQILLHRAFGLAVLGLLFSIQVATLIQDKSPVTDAVAFHTVNGYVNLVENDYRMSPATPPLIRKFMTLPWLIWQPDVDWDHASWKAADSVPFAMHFFYETNRDIAWKLIVSSRIMNYLLALTLLAFAYLWSRQLYGGGSALFALLILCFSPTFVAFSSLANIEIGISLFYLATMYFLYQASLKPEKNAYLIACAISFGLALASKYTAVLLIPLVGLFVLQQKGMKRGVISLAWMAVLALVVVSASYNFQFKPLLEGVPRVDEKMDYIIKIVQSFVGPNASIESWVLHLAQTLPLPLADWFLGFAGIARSHQSTYAHYFMGEWTDYQHWYHYFVSFGLKMTLGFLSLLALRILFPRSKGKRFLLLPPLILFVMTTIDTTGVGMRYLIPTIPFLSIWISGLCVEVGKRALLKALILIFICMHILSAMHSFPNQIAYFNEIIGGSKNGHLYFRANDLEWGQELFNLGKYLKSKDMPPIRHALFGDYDASFYGIEGNAVSADDYKVPAKTVYAISVYKKDWFEWTKEHEPVAIIGHTVWVYDFRSS